MAPRVMRRRIYLGAVIIVSAVYLAGYVYWRQNYVGREDDYEYTYFDENHFLTDGPLMLLWYPVGGIDRFLTGRGYEMRDIKIRSRRPAVP